MIDKHRRPTKLLWVDLEMTGLDAEHDRILEVAALVTNFDFADLAEYYSAVAQPKPLVEERLALWPEEFQTNKQIFLRLSQTGEQSEAIEQALIGLVEKQFGDEPAVLAGNSIHKDREFIKRWWPKLDMKLHYRMLDVSSMKVYMQGRFGVEFQKEDVHRALDDIRASIAEWRYYMELLAEPVGKKA